jgi:hypothetical protein
MSVSQACLFPSTRRVDLLNFRIIVSEGQCNIIISITFPLQVVKLMYFLRQADEIVDARLERALSVDDLTNLLALPQYTVLSTAELAGAHSMHDSIHLYFVGTVAKDSVEKIEQVMSEVYARIEPGLRVEMKMVAPMVGEKG